MRQTSISHLRVVIIDDDAPIRNALRELVNAMGGEVIGEAEGGASGTELVQKLEPDMLLLDVSMPGMDGFAVASQLQGLLPELPIIFVSQHADRAYAEEAFRSGAKGYVVKRAATNELHDAMDTVMSGQMFCSTLVR